jgi:hypothetical protein
MELFAQFTPSDSTDIFPNFVYLVIRVELASSILVLKRKLLC